LAKSKEKIPSNQERPDHFTQISFYINLAVSIYFLFWNLLTLLTINNTNLIEKYKHLSVSEMIEKRGKNLGFDWQEFQTSLNQYYVISLILFIPIALGLYLLWKKRSVFYMLIVISFLLQILLMVILLGPSYFWNDNTFTDKILLLVILVNSSIYRGLLKKEDQSGKISFFDQD
jgi:hypothetical protein